MGVSMIMVMVMVVIAMCVIIMRMHRCSLSKDAIERDFQAFPFLVGGT
jgi:hypothetical protein